MLTTMHAKKCLHLGGIRQSRVSRFWARLLVLILAAGVVSPGWVWCHAGDGHVALEYGGICSLLPICDPASDATCVKSDLADSSDGCVDEPIFSVEAIRGFAQDEVSLISDAAFVSTYAPPLTSNSQSLVCLDQDIYQINSTLSSLRSTTLLI